MTATVRFAPTADQSAYALLTELGAGRVTQRPGRPPRAERGHVSVARTDGLVAAVVDEQPVGIDVERIRPLPDLEILVRDHLGAADAAAVLGAADPTYSFHQLWTRLEALLKAAGVGIVDGLDPSPEVRARWQVTTLDAGPDHCAALARPADSARRRVPGPSSRRAVRSESGRVGVRDGRGSR